EGRRVGVNRGYTVTTGLWARSILQHEYGVDLGRVTWVLSGDEHVAEYRPPANVVAIEPGRTLEELLLAGEIAAAIGITVDSPEAKPLIPDPQNAGFEALRQRGIYPINHTIVIRNDRLESNPGLARDLFEALGEAKRMYVQRLRDGRIDPSTSSEAIHLRVMEMIGDPLPYGIEPNRKTLEAVVQYAVEQRILSRPVAVEELFEQTTLALFA